MSTFYFTAGGAGLVAAVRLLFGTCNPWFSPNVHWDVQAEGDVINDATGDIVGSWSETPGALVNGNGQANYADGVGGRIVWNTGQKRNNRPVRGSTYMLPLTVQAYGPDGLLTSAWSGDAGNAAAALVANSANELRVWSRPSPGTANGTSHIVTSALAPRLPSWLRSRKT